MHICLQLIQFCTPPVCSFAFVLRRNLGLTPDGFGFVDVFAFFDGFFLVFFFGGGLVSFLGASFFAPLVGVAGGATGFVTSFVAAGLSGFFSGGLGATVFFSAVFFSGPTAFALAPCFPAVFLFLFNCADTLFCFFSEPTAFALAPAFFCFPPLAFFFLAITLCQPTRNRNSGSLAATRILGHIFFI